RSLQGIPGGFKLPLGAQNPNPPLSSPSRSFPTPFLPAFRSHCHGVLGFSFGVSTFPDFDESDSDADEDIQLDQKTNGVILSLLVTPIVKSIYVPSVLDGLPCKSIVKVEQAKSTAGKPKVPQANAPASKAKPKIEELKKADKQKANKDDDEESEEDESDDDEVCSMAVKYVIFLFDKLFTSSVFQCLFCCLFCLFGLVLIYDMVEAEDDSEDEDEDEVESSDEDEAPVKKFPSISILISESVYEPNKQFFFFLGTSTLTMLFKLIQKQSTVLANETPRSCLGKWWGFLDGALMNPLWVL
ncbi:hypothetical protein B296_00032066, partial [Ensete ventricosum]